MKTKGNTGKKFSKEHKQKISDALKGKKKSKEHCKNLSKAMKGHTNQQGEKHSQWKGGISKTKEYKYQKAREWIGRNKDKQREYWQKRYALQKEAVGQYSSDEWEELKRQTQYMCVCCKKGEPEIKLEADHIIPLTKGGTNFIHNIQPLCRSCNARKNNRDTINYLQLNNLCEHIPN